MGDEEIQNTYMDPFSFEGGGDVSQAQWRYRMFVERERSIDEENSGLHQISGSRSVAGTESQCIF